MRRTVSDFESTQQPTEVDPHVEETWRMYFTEGKTPDDVPLTWFEHRSIRPFVSKLPSDPRCQVCHYPFGGVGGKLVRSLLRLQPSKMNPHMCNVCERFAEENYGGAEVEVAMLFADVRGSTPLAASMDAQEFGRLMNRFYSVTTNIVYDNGGMVEKLVGDEVVAFFAPAFSRNRNFSRAAITAAREMLAATGHVPGRKPRIPVGIGVHAGTAYVGAVGEPGKSTSIAVLGDNVNITSRLTGHAHTGEIVISERARELAGLPSDSLESRDLMLKGKDEPFAAWIERPVPGETADFEEPAAA